MSSIVFDLSLDKVYGLLETLVTHSAIQWVMGITKNMVIDYVAVLNTVISLRG